MTGKVRHKVVLVIYPLVIYTLGESSINLESDTEQQIRTDRLARKLGLLTDDASEDLFDSESWEISVDCHVVVFTGQIVLTEHFQKLSLRPQAIQKNRVIRCHLQHPFAE